MKNHSQEILLWHVYSDGTRADIPFYEEEDKVYAMNSVAIIAYKTGVTIWVVTINDTHLHLIAKGNEGEVKMFVKMLKRRYSTFMARGGRSDLLGESFSLSMGPITGREELLVKFMYVYRNCLDFYDMVPWDYPWGSGNLYFSDKSQIRSWKSLAELTCRERFSLLHTKQDLPGNWRIDQRCMILPLSFVAWNEVESFFGSNRAFLAFMHINREKEVALKQTFHQKYLDNGSIQELRKIGEKICRKKYKVALRMASFNIRLKVAGEMISSRIASKNSSLAKAVYLHMEDLNILL